MPVKKTRVAVLVSGGGTYLQALLDARAAGRLQHAELALVISDRADAYALARAEQASLPALCFDRAALGWPAAEEAILGALREHRIGLVVLAGFLSILSPGFVRAYENRVVNVHPSLLPAFCGKGFYGLKVHQAALERGVKLTGASVHLVSELPDAGPILGQKAVRVRRGDTPQTLQRRVMEQAEWVLLPKVVEACCRKLSRLEELP